MVKKIILLFILNLFLFCCLSNNIDMTEKNIIRKSDCIEIIIQKQKGNKIYDRIFYLTDFDRLKNLFNKEKLSYVGSNEKYHFFFWYTKIQYYEDQPRGFAVLRDEYTPKNPFDVKENRIGEAPFK